MEAYQLLFEHGAAFGPRYERNSTVVQTYIRLPQGWQMIDTLIKHDHAWDRHGVHRKPLGDYRYRAMIVDDKDRRICVVDFEPSLSYGWVHIADRYDTRVVFENGTLNVQVMDGTDVLFETDPIPFDGDSRSADPEVYDELTANANTWAEMHLGGDSWRTIKCNTYFDGATDES
jgi:hypothetical protein